MCISSVHECTLNMHESMHRTMHISMHYTMHTPTREIKHRNVASAAGEVHDAYSVRCQSAISPYPGAAPTDNAPIV
jgi:hypothetical protein